MTSSRCVGRQDADLLQVHEVPAAVRVEARLLQRGEHPDRARRGRRVQAGRVGRQLLEPAQGTFDFRAGEPGTFQFQLQRLAVGFEAIFRFGVEIVLEQVDQDVEDAFLHHAFLGNRRQ